MPRYQFSISSPTERVRLAGAITSETFSQALEAIADQADAGEGDTLEIGVKGFPPARFELTESAEDGTIGWRPAGLLAA
ncbi:MAG TPA: hypothetical protein VFK04_16440 [Gemmatimonadaceae bacterium]|jgi:hypothetical protein|nr:hypothetical protein [Gemmatimonadaceae bacterium]